MDDWARVDAYAQHHPRWFESPRYYEPSTELLDVFHEGAGPGWTVERQGLWYVAEPPGQELGEQGWKIHVSVRSEDSERCLRRSTRIFREAGTAFKFLVDRRTVSAANGKLWARSSGGKFIAAYPKSDDEFIELGNALAAELFELAGPYILTDRRWPNSQCVFYRYGGFRALPILQVDGSRQMGVRDPDGVLIPDDRNPFWSPPDWVSDPIVTSGLPRTGDEPPALGGGRFAVTSALRFSNRGGVYKGVDLDTGKAVVIKESRPLIVIGRHGVDAVAALEKEHRILSALAGTGLFAAPVAFFQEGGHAFLVEEFLSGGHLGNFTILHNPLYRGDITVAKIEKYLSEVRQIWIELARAIAAAHAHDIVLGDLSLTNVMVSESLGVTVVDLECAVEEGVDPQIGLHTPGMAAPHARDSGTADRANDCYALGAMIFGSIMLANGISDLHPPARKRFLDELMVDLALPDQLLELIDELMAPPGAEPVRAADIITSIRRIPASLGNSVTAVPRLASTERHLSGTDGVELRRRVTDTRDGVIEYLMRTADTERRDRLFPADLTVFETNPLSVAHGAAGVLFALQRLTGEVPRSLDRWFTTRQTDGSTIPPGLYVGQSGIAWVLHELGSTERAVSLLREVRAHPLLWRSPNVMWGAAGYGMACLRFWSAGLGEEFLEDAVRVGAHLARASKHDDRGVFWPDADGGVPLGYAYGGSGISLFLLYLGRATDDRQTCRMARQALDFELGNAVFEHGKLLGFPELALDEPDPAGVVARCYWDAGTAGVATCLARHLRVAPDEQLRSWLEPLAFDLSHKYAVFPQLFHGLAGLGNALLDVWEVSHDDRHLDSVWRLAEGVLLFRLERPEGIGFPGEQCLRESADFATGAAGIGLFLHRLLATEGGPQANFNFLVDDVLVPERPMPQHRNAYS